MSKIFISYGHESVYVNAVRSLAKAIEDLNHQVFLDTNYIDQGDWSRIIDTHIDGCDFFFFTVSAETVDYERYCLKELARAGQLKKNIIPIVLDRNVIVPTGINNLHRLYLSDCLDHNFELIPSKFADFIKNLDNIFSGNFSKYTDENKNLFDLLKPLSQSEKLFYYNMNFCGRDEVFDIFENFVRNSSKKIMWINAQPGSGKSAFSAALSWKYPEIVSAIHFCQYNNLDRINPKNIISTIAFQLSKYIPEYKQKLVSLSDLNKIFDKSSARMFEYLLVEQLHEINVTTPHVIVIDALDEATNRSENEIATLLYQNVEHLPSWLKFVVTSRNEPEIASKIEFISHKVEFSEESNEKDLFAYYKSQFPEATEKQLSILITKSEGRFLYASKIVEQIKENNTPLDDLSFLPIGIYGFFYNCFNRLFPEENATMKFEEVRNFLELLCVSKEPLSKDFVVEYLEKDEYFVVKILNLLAPLFPFKSGIIEPLHKSVIDWITNEEVSHKYYISRKIANEHLANYCEKEYTSKHFKNPFVFKHYLNVLREINTQQSISKIVSLVNDSEFMESIIDNNLFDKGLYQYIDILKYLKSNDVNLDTVFESETFKKIFIKNRRILYNSGGFKDLKKLNLTPFIDKSGSWGFNGEVAKAFYYYITEEFEKCIKKVNSVLKFVLLLANKPTLQAELLNVRGLSQRKLVLFSEALKSFDQAIKLAQKGIDKKDNQDGDPEFELSLAYLIKGKITLRMLEFDKSNDCSIQAIEILTRRINSMEDSDKKTSNTLFLAEDKRVTADGYIWQGNYLVAENLLDECETIYNDNFATTDRYYIRYLYTKLFLRIVRNDDFDCRNELESLVEKTKDSYDAGMVNYYLGLDSYFKGKEDKERLKFGYSKIQIAIAEFEKIKAYLERDICITLAYKIGKLLGKIDRFSTNINEYSVKWCKNFEDFIK